MERISPTPFKPPNRQPNHLSLLPTLWYLNQPDPNHFIQYGSKSTSLKFSQRPSHGSTAYSALFAAFHPNRRAPKIPAHKAFRNANWANPSQIGSHLRLGHRLCPGPNLRRTKVKTCPPRDGGTVKRSRHGRSQYINTAR